MYFGPALSPVSNARAVKAITRPDSLQIGNITRLRNRSYIRPGTTFPLWSSESFELKSPEARSVSASAKGASRSRSPLKLSGAYPSRKVLIASAETPRPAKYSRASAPSEDRSCSSNHAAAVSCRSNSFRRCPASAASSGELNSRLGSGMPHFCATIRTASGNPAFSILPTKLKTSPDCPHPKQW